DLHQMWMSEKTKPPTADFRAPEIELVALGPEGAELRKTNLHSDRNLRFFKYVFYPVRNDYLGGDYPPGHPAAAKQYLLKSPQSPLPPVCPEAYLPDSLDDLYWDVGRVQVALASAENARIIL